MSLEILGQEVARDLRRIGYDARPCTLSRPGIHDVVIVGGGQSGLGAAFALKRERIGDLLVLDENPAGSEGPWETYARMATLRTPKSLTGIDMGVPSLTFRAWWEAQHGEAGWDSLGFIPRVAWMSYLRWFRQVLDLPVRNDVKVARIEPVEAGYRVHFADGESVVTRKVVLATGIQGGGQWQIPASAVNNLPPDRYAHSSSIIDYAGLAGKRIAILGGGASAFDNAQHALTQGAASAHVFVRRATLPTVNPIRFMERTGMISRYPALSDDDKYRVMASFFERSQPPTNDMFSRAAAMPGFQLHLGAPWNDIQMVGDEIEIRTPGGVINADFLVFATGLITDPALRPELAEVADAIELWRDRELAMPLRSAVLDAHPYLGPGFELSARDPSQAARLHGLFAFNYSALMSLGISAAALSGLKHALPRLARAVADQLFIDDKDEIIADYLAFDEAEFVAGPASLGAAA